MHDLEIPLTENRLVGRFGEWKTVYSANTGEAATILRDTFRAAEAYDIDAVLDALCGCSELCQMAAAVADIKTIEQMDNEEALSVLIRMRGSDRPEWSRILAGREMVRRGVK